jgi:hypothetical protein
MNTTKTTGEPGSPSATTTISGTQLPATAHAAALVKD